MKLMWAARTPPTQKSALREGSRSGISDETICSSAAQMTVRSLARRSRLDFGEESVLEGSGLFA